MTKIVISTLAELKAFRNKIRSLRGSISRTSMINIERAADEAVLTDIRRAMEMKNFSKKIIQATNVGDIQLTQNSLKVHFISDYVSDGGFDVSKAREEGTTDHMIRPVNKKYLSWIDPNSGKKKFSLGHVVSGMDRLLIIERTINRNQQKFTDSLERANIQSNRQALS